MHKAMNIYLKNGFDSFFIDDHVPQTNRGNGVMQVELLQMDIFKH